MTIAVKTLLSSVVGMAAFALLLFAPAGTLRYWQAWVFLAVFTLATVAFCAYMLRTDPAALVRRMHAGPLAETRPLQRIASAMLFVAFLSALVISALDHRFNWSPVPPPVSVVGEVLVAVGLCLAMLVVAQNSYAAATITVESDQKLASTGLYGVVRHPMYTGALVMLIGMPLALDSYRTLGTAVVGLAAFVLRIRDEEHVLEQQLPGYREYRRQVRYRLLPGVW